MLASALTLCVWGSSRWTRPGWIRICRGVLSGRLDVLMELRRPSVCCHRLTRSVPPHPAVWVREDCWSLPFVVAPWSGPKAELSPHVVQQHRRCFDVWQFRIEVRFLLTIVDVLGTGCFSTARTVGTGAGSWARFPASGSRARRVVRRPWRKSATAAARAN